MSPMLNRRDALRAAACGFGSLAMMSLFNTSAQAGLVSAAHLIGPHFQPRAKRVIFLFLHGGLSHVDSFDPKPRLEEMNGKPLPLAKPKFEFAPTGNLLASPWKFSRYGQSGMEVSELFPHIGGIVDDICLIRSMNGGDQVSHGPAQLNLNTGSGVAARPSVGAWALYGLGSDNQNLPGFISLSPSLYHGGAQNYGSAFLPASCQGTRIGDGSTPFKSASFSNLQPADAPALQRLQLDLLARRNRDQLTTIGPDPRLEARIAAAEMSFRMQMEAPHVLDLNQESEATRRLYGIGEEPTDEYGRQCLLARRFVEAGVRFVQVNHSYPRSYWDAHAGLRDNHTSNARKIDKPVAGLIRDLKSRGLLEDTLVVFATEFGRTPAAQGSDGRDHHPHAFSIWMAGAGTRAGHIHGRTDEFGYYIAENKVTMPDFHATILHLLGIDHTRLTYRHAGRDYRLTDVSGEVVRAALA